MTHITFEAANQIYSCCASHTLSSVTVDNSELHSFFHAVNHLEHQLEDSASDDVWNHLFIRLRRHWFDMTTAPLPANWGAVELTGVLRTCAEQCRVSYPRWAPSVDRLCEQFDTLTKSSANPLLDTIQELAGTYNLTHGALLVRAPHLASAVVGILAKVPALSQLDVVNIYEMRDPDCYETLLAIGPRHWFPDYIFSAPRASTLITVRYKWPADKWHPHPVFLGSIARDSCGMPDVPLGEAKRLELEEAATEGNLEPGGLIWPLDLGARSSHIDHHSVHNQELDDVKAHLAMLSGGTAVWLEITDEVKALVLDLEADEEDDDGAEDEQSSRIRRIATSSIRPGMFLLLRTSGGGDYIIPIADQILGDRSQRLREMQEEWKSKLRTAVLSRGLLAVSIELLDRGSERANEINVRNWTLARNIRPRDYRDFQAIMRLVGLENHADEYWQAAETIDAAHRKAGFQLRRQLLKQVQASDLRMLQKRGRLDFPLPEEEGGSLAAFRVEYIGPNSFLIPASRLGRPFQLEDW